ncbi:MAG: hypothetical protein AUF76_09155 [Acidobacteria bacterium 13_1_20CM_2_65_9]|nr:MAG: hypothetical protein AUF76_09155 [Acidobacteria bacterium 13_1_20CM_2_65_9]
MSAAGSGDPENDPLTFTWTEGTNTLARTVDPTRTSTVGLAVGVHNITLTVDDGFGGVSTATVAVDVQDATAPLHALIAGLAAENASLTAQNQQLQQELAASQQTIADAVSTIQANLRASFDDPSFSKACRQHLYKNLGGQKNLDDDDR